MGKIMTVYGIFEQIYRHPPAYTAFSPYRICPLGAQVITSSQDHGGCDREGDTYSCFIGFNFCFFNLFEDKNSRRHRTKNFCCFIIHTRCLFNS